LFFVVMGRLLVRAVIRARRRRGHLLRRTLIVGANEEAGALLHVLLRAPETGLAPVGYLRSAASDPGPGNEQFDGLPCLGKGRDITDIVKREQIDTVVIASTAFNHEVTSRLIAELRGLDVSIHLSSGLFEILTSRVLVREVAGVPLVTVRPIPLSRGNLAMKRAFDVVASATILLAGMPLWALIALAIVLESKGPVFYKQARVGHEGQPFGMYKFRSMVDDADARLAQLLEENEASGPLFKMKNDPRVTRVGRWMRKYSIDEFPQLLNVVRGEMSLVGPRPPLIQETEQYTDYHWRRMEVPPGLTGLWQVSGRSKLTFDEMVRLDLYYIENWSMTFDIALLLRTIPAVIFAPGAY
jgi:exopolysaccharide biosynthesis polyprenyl glycosylphosphotransferase